MSDTDGSRTLHTEQDRLSLPEVRLDDLLDEVRSRMSMISATQERIRTLLEAVVSIGEGLELDPLLVRITETATSLVDARYGALGVIGPDGEMSRFIPVGLSEHEISRIDHWPRGEGILGLLVEEPEPLRLQDVSEHPESRGFPEGHPPMHTFLGVPIRIRDQVFGNLYMTDKRDGSEFTSDDELLLRALATAAGTAIENAQLFASRAAARRGRTRRAASRRRCCPARRPRRSCGWSPSARRAWPGRPRGDRDARGGAGDAHRAHVGGPGRRRRPG